MVRDYPQRPAPRAFPRTADSFRRDVPTPDSTLTNIVKFDARFFALICLTSVFMSKISSSCTMPLPLIAWTLSAFLPQKEGQEAW
jgi:hypothetical protein